MHEVVFTGLGHWAEYIDQLSTPINLGEIYEVQSMVFSLNDTDLRIFKDTQNYEHVNELVPAPYHVHCEFEDKKNLFLYGEYPHPAFTHKNEVDEYTIFIDQALHPSFQIDKSKHPTLKPYESNTSNHSDYDAKQDIVVSNNLIDLASLSRAIEKLYKMTSTESAQYILKKIINECPVYSSSYNNNFHRLTISDVKKFDSNCYASDYESFEADSNADMKAKELHITKSAALNFFDLPYNTWFEFSEEVTTSAGSVIIDISHPLTSHEFNVALKAWKEVLETNPSKPNTGSRKKLLENWLDQNNSDFKLSSAARERIATLLNPDNNGGAPISN
jgi:hypothetical protein